eukprot:gene5455-7549_t
MDRPRTPRIERSQSEGTWLLQREKALQESRNRRFVVFAADVWADTAKKLEILNPERFKYFPIHWGKFPDGTDDILICGFTPNEIAGENVLFFASFHNNDVTLSQFSALIVLSQSFIESMTIILPFFPVGTMERVETEGRVATANTYSMLLSNLPTCGKPNRLMIYDIHTLQNRFYFHSSTISSLHTSIPLLLERILRTAINAVAFPDDGAAKRFGAMFRKAGFDIIICGKVRDNDRRIVKIQDGEPVGKSIVIVDDLVQTGGTLYECAQALKSAGAKSVSCYVAHAVFPNDAWTQFCRNTAGSKAVFDHFWLTNSVPSVTSRLPTDDVFEVLDLLPQILADLEL